MLGPGIVLLGVPTALVCALRAVRGAPDRGAAWIAMVVSAAEMAVLAYGVYRMATDSA